MPGIETTAPDRTETSRGFSGSAKRLPAEDSRSRIEATTWSIRPSGSSPPFARYALHASVVIVNPGGTGSPNEVISASPAPLPPSSSFRLESPEPKDATQRDWSTASVESIRIHLVGFLGLIQSTLNETRDGEGERPVSYMGHAGDGT